MVKAPDRGDVVWIDFAPQAGHVKSIDWKARHARPLADVDAPTLAAVLGKLIALLD